MNKSDQFYYIEGQPLVSIVIPSYNSASTLAEALDSVLIQTYTNIEVIVVDDGSTDETQDVLSRYASHVISISQENGGLAAARNAGCLVANGKYIALMDADDICMPARIAVQVEYMEQYPDIIMCSSDFLAFQQKGVIADSYIATYYSQIAETPRGIAGIYPQHQELCLAGNDVMTYSGYVYEQMALGNFIHPPTVLFRRIVLDECGLADESILYSCDFDWLLRMSHKGIIGFIDCSLLKYRISEFQRSSFRSSLKRSHDFVMIVERNLAADPELFQRNRKLFNRCLGNAYLDVANGLADNRPIAALAKLIKSAALGVMCMQTLKVFLKIFTPYWFLLLKRNRAIV